SMPCSGPADGSGCSRARDRRRSRDSARPAEDRNGECAERLRSGSGSRAALRATRSGGTRRPRACARPDSATRRLSAPMPPATGPVLIAHRGAAADAPENTIAAFELALEPGADGLDLDVHLSADEHPVVIHDFTLERTTDGAGPVSALRVRELKRLDAGGGRDRRFEGQRVQTLQEVFERFRDRTRFWLELKGGCALYPGLEERVVSTIEIYDVVDRVLVQSFDPDGARHRPEPELGD